MGRPKKEEIKEEQPTVKKRGRPKKATVEQQNISKKAKTVTSGSKSAKKVAKKTTKKDGVGGNGNLIPFDQRTEAEQREIRSKGGKASVESRRRKKELREFMKDFLMQDASPALQQNLKALGVETEQMTNLAALCTRLFTKVMSTGDLNAARTMIEWSGMAPLQQERENEAIARMSQVMQIARNGDSEENKEEEETVVFYIPQNGRDVMNGDNLVTIEDG